MIAFSTHPAAQTIAELCNSPILPEGTFAATGGEALLNKHSAPEERQRLEASLRTLPGFLPMACANIELARSYDIGMDAEADEKNAVIMDKYFRAGHKQLQKTTKILEHLASGAWPQPFEIQQLKLLLSPVPESGTLSLLGSALRAKAKLVEEIMDALKEKNSGDYAKVVQMVGGAHFPPSKPPTLEAAEAFIKTSIGRMRESADCLDICQREYDERLGKLLSHEKGL